jgi:hypothetical protein
MKKDELMDLCDELCLVLNTADITNDEAVELALNFFGTVLVTSKVPIHSAVSGVMQYYKMHHADR